MNKYSVLLWAFLLSGVFQGYSQEQKHSFVLGDSTFLLDGKPFQMISGEMHYPRVPREAWRARMKMAKAMGLNTIGTYVFWNLHEPQKGHFDFTGNNDVAEFVKIAKEEGLWVILRPSPYVCAEWEFGGYPYWLQNEKGLIVRSMDEKYIREYRKYINAVGKQLAPLQINHGGNILMVQIENEYGSYSNDKTYLALNQQLFKEAGFDGLLYTCDPATDVANGHLPGMLPAVNGIDSPARIRQIINENHNGKGPYYVAEWYPAWFDWWGAPHHTIPAEQYTGGLDSVLAAGISINMYMFHGGTTRGFMNGANFKDISPYEPQVSSYDYDAPLDEAGNATAKFMKFREVIQKHLPPDVQLPDVPVSKPAMVLPSIQFTETTTLNDLLPKPVFSQTPLTFEDLHQDYGFVLYRTKIKDGHSGMLTIKELRDYALIMVNGKRVGILDRRLNQDSLPVLLPKGEVVLDILVENLGRINFGKYLLQNKKGITQQVLMNNKEILNWQMFSLPFENADHISFKPSVVSSNEPVIKKASFSLDQVADTYLDMENWGKGVVWVNGHNLGRYWNIGPQQTLYLPAEWLKKGNNEIVVLELLKPEINELQSVSKPILDHLAVSDSGRVDAVDNYKLVWADEFNTDGAPDAKNWKFEQGFVRNNELQWYQPQNARCSNGMLVIEARKEHLPNPLYNPQGNNWKTRRQFIEYTAASLNTAGLQNWKYGRFVMRARIDTSAGLWPAFWTLGVKGAWPSNGEIDIMEYYRKEVLANIACATNTPYHPKWYSNTKAIKDFGGTDWAEKFHIWRMDWDEKGISLYIDDELLTHVDMDQVVNQDGSGISPFTQPQYMLLDLAIGGDNGGNPSATTFPRKFEIDYVRVYQK